MFPRRFRATVIQRMALWGAMLGFLLLLLVIVEVIHFRKLSSGSREAENLASALAATSDFGPRYNRARLAGLNLPGGEANPDVAAIREIFADIAARPLSEEAVAFARQGIVATDDVKTAIRIADQRRLTEAWMTMLDRRSVLGKTLSEGFAHIHASLAAHLNAHRQNRLLIATLALFLIAQIVFLEYRWMVRPIVRLAASLGAAQDAPAILRVDAMRRDEIGSLAQALTQHYALRRREEATAREEKSVLASRVARQEEFKQASLAFQNRVAGIVRDLQAAAGQMAAASGDLAMLSRDADSRAAEASASTQRASDHVDSVATSVGDIAATLTQVSGEASRTAAVAIGAKDVVLAASEETRELVEAVRVIEQVVGLIQDVANQTNLLSLNATIEAARVGESGRGFAVVASEVKQLATRTSLATEDVRQKLEAVTSASTRISERVRALVGSIDEIDSAAAVIAALMRKQDASSQAISSSTERTAADVRSVASKVETVAGMIGDAKQAADLVTKVSADLNGRAGELRDIVQDFIRTTEGLAA